MEVLGPRQLPVPESSTDLVTRQECSTNQTYL